MNSPEKAKVKEAVKKGACRAELRDIKGAQLCVSRLPSRPDPATHLRRQSSPP